MSEHLWGIDVGGTKLEGVVLRKEDPLHPLVRLRVPTEAAKGYEQVLQNIVSLVEKMKTETGLDCTRIGFGTPGALDPATGLLKNSNTRCLRGQPIKDDLQKRLQRDVEIANDANCFALAESIYGAAKGAHCVFGVIMGTGVGGGIVVNGQCLHGAQGIAGEWGHNVLDPDGPDCYCGKRGCVETILSGPALERYYRSQTGDTCSLKEIVEKANANNVAAQSTIASLSSWFGKALAVVINILDPDVIVLGGGVSNVDVLYKDGIARVAESVFNTDLKTKIVKHELGDSAGVFGAALLARGGDHE